MEIPKDQMCECCEVNPATCETDLQTDEETEQPVYWWTCESCHDWWITHNFQSWKNDPLEVE